MQLSFLQERRYWPYAKWFGTAFSRLDAAAALGPLLDAALAARDHPAREKAVVGVLEFMAGQHKAIGATPPADTSPGPFQVHINDPDIRRPVGREKGGSFG